MPIVIQPVAVGVVVNQNWEQKHLLACQRPADKIIAPYKWELPRGAVETGETLEEALHRGLEDSLHIDCMVGKEIANVVCSFEFGNFDFHFFRVKAFTGNPRAVAHRDIRWVGPSDMESLDWIDCDRIVGYLALLETDNNLTSTENVPINKKKISPFVAAVGQEAMQQLLEKTPEDTDTDPTLENLEDREQPEEEQ